MYILDYTEDFSQREILTKIFYDECDVISAISEKSNLNSYFRVRRISKYNNVYGTLKPLEIVYDGRLELKEVEEIK